MSNIHPDPVTRLRDFLQHARANQQRLLDKGYGNPVENRGFVQGIEQCISLLEGAPSADHLIDEALDVLGDEAVIKSLLGED